MIKKSILLSISVVLLSVTGFSQFGFEFDNSIVVKQGADTLNNAWGGGLNYAQVSDFDYDFDGDLDIFLFDRSSNNIRVLVQEGSGANKHYELAYNSRLNFPDGLLYRATMVDYDQDGRKDLWTYGLGGLKVYRNVGDISNGLQWELITDLLLSEYPNGESSLFVSGSDIPALVDVDFDGDIDVLTFHQGGVNVEYHQNQSMELYGIPDSLIYVLRNECWGLFSEDFTTNVITLNETDFPCTGGDIPNPIKTNGPVENQDIRKKHSGSTLLAIDIDNSGVYDLVLGDVSYPTMTLLMNAGVAPNTNSPMISQDNSFPSNTTPVDMQLFPAAFYLDVDFDGVKDLVVTPNARNISENETSVRFYKNTGTNTLPTFVYSANDLFQNEMIDHGKGSIPVLFDYNEDGLSDLLVANFYRYIPTLDKETTLAYYQNTGTANDPVYTYVDYNLFDLDQENFGFRSVPAFGDIDGDGDEDMLLGVEDGTLVYYQNNSVGSGSNFGLPQTNFLDNNGTPVTSGAYAFPQLFDLDDDGLLDIILGARTGELIYYKNIGTVNSPSFELTNSNLGNVDLTGSNSPYAYGAPHFFRVNNETKLFAGEFEGKLHYYDDIDANLAVGDTFDLVSNNYLNIDVQAYSSFFVQDINNDGELNMLVGQDLGGLFHFEADPNSNASVTESSIEQLALYPNPAADKVVITSENTSLRAVKVFDLQGKCLVNSQMNAKEVELDIQLFDQGVYTVVIVLDNEKHIVKKLIKL